MNPTINSQATSLRVFYNENENVSIRTEVIDNDPWFVAKDVAMALDITWNGKTLASIPEGWKGARNLLTPSSGTRGGGEQSLIVINESAMYKLAFRSNKPEADRFVNWIAGSVLPSIRRTGSYSTAAQTPVNERKKLPLPKYRPYFDTWKEHVAHRLCADDACEVANFLGVSYGHVRKVFLGTSVSERVARALNARALQNKRKGIYYEAAKPVYEQLSIEWEQN